jgi:hypothetical protein
MADENEIGIAAARRRVQEAEAKFERQQRRYAMLALDGDATTAAATAAARAAMAECEAEREAAREALQLLEEGSRGA